MTQNPTVTVLRPETAAGSPESVLPEFPPLQHYIGGAFVDSDGSDTETLVDPSTGAAVAQVPSGTVSDVDKAVQAAVLARRAWGRTTPGDRAAALLKIADLVEANAEVLKALESLDTGKPLSTSDDDVAGAADCFRFSAGAARAYTELGSGEYYPGHTSVVVREPIGVIGAVVPWNYPLLMGVWKIAPILAAGNTLIIKPSEQTPLSLLKLAQLIDEADLLPAGVLNVVLGKGTAVGDALSSHPSIDMVALTGSVRAGSAVAESASASLKRVHLELGGKAPMVILADADLPEAAELIRTAGYYNNGQECGAGTRVLIHESVADEFTKLLKAQVETFVIGDHRASESVELGPFITEAQFERVKAFVRRAIDDGAIPVIGGQAAAGEGFFYEPTILTNVAPDSEAAHEEIFGPVVTIETFETTEEAIERANDVKYGLAASVWTSNAKAAMELPLQLDFGTVWVNTHLVLANEVPWGGFKGSGYGRDLSIYALQDYSRTKHIQHNHA
ncbi:aldehyde dehydrogenase family protein [Galactobacter sp.]|uniref:aldehyde dehydrogenase family protein n=1 Tax=Galactobacter sp. TaxID=2676125 RepID=UPI0025BE8589|nr:aldehyde dehydrogenase family protein [Galactobacter sp.]